MATDLKEPKKEKKKKKHKHKKHKDWDGVFADREYRCDERIVRRTAWRI